MNKLGRYDHLSREALIALIERRDAQRRYGLVWEREGIEQDRALNEDFVALDLDADLSTAPSEEGGWRNLVIEGDNWDALRALRLAYAGRVKCILIDPPYNTGSRDFTYNDRFIGAQDRYRQSLWLEFLYRRLLLARDLLADDGVILVCINDENRARLDLLMEQAFPGMRIGSFVWRTRTAGGGSTDHYLSIDHEHILVYGNPGFSFEGLAKSFDMYRQTDEKGAWRVVALSKRENRLTRPNSYFPLQNPATGIWYPCNPDRVWAYVRRQHLVGSRSGNTSIEDMIAGGRVVFPSGGRVATWPTREALTEAIRSRDVPTAGNGALLLRDDLPDDILDFFVGKPVGFGTLGYKLYAWNVQSSTQAVSSIVEPTGGRENRNALRAGTNAEGTRTLRNIFGGEVFSYPQPLSLFSELIRHACGANSTIVDFFAGSGTTAHAVLSLNAEDHGNRRFIMVSDREAASGDPDRNLARDICAERIRRVLGGSNGEPGLDGDFAYLRVRRIRWDDVLYDLDAAAIWTLLQLRHDRPLRTFDPAVAVQIAVPEPETPEDPTLAYLPVVTEGAVAVLRSLAGRGPIIAFAPVPGLLRDLLAMESVPIEQVPDRLLAEFPGVVAGL